MPSQGNEAQGFPSRRNRSGDELFLALKGATILKVSRSLKEKT